MTDTPLDSLYATIRRHLQVHAALLWDVSLALHRTPEPAFEEHRAAKLLADRLETAGFAVERGVAGMPTAFVARAEVGGGGAYGGGGGNEYGGEHGYGVGVGGGGWNGLGGGGGHRLARGTAQSYDYGGGTRPGAGGGPRVALLLEYDALPGLGHACGHNLIAAAGLGAGLALRAALAEAGEPVADRGGEGARGSGPGEGAAGDGSQRAGAPRVSGPGEDSPDEGSPRAGTQGPGAPRGSAAGEGPGEGGPGGGAAGEGSPRAGTQGPGAPRGSAAGDGAAGGGTLLVVGTPAEERGGGKVIAVEAGLFDGVDAALMFHPGVHDWAWAPLTASARVRVAFHGRAAHPTGSPTEGIDALAALIELFNTLSGLARRFPPGSHIQGIVTDGGKATNIVPDYAEGVFGLRGATTAELDDLVARLGSCADGIAHATGTTAETTRLGTGYQHFRDNPELSGRFTRHLARTGIRLTEPTPGTFLGSSDIGNVSTRVPAIHPFVAILGSHGSDHTPEFAAAAASPRARDVLLAAAEALACTAADVLLIPELREAAWSRLREQAARNQ